MLMAFNRRNAVGDATESSGEDASTADETLDRPGRPRRALAAEP
jgi:hypothetical protein